MRLLTPILLSLLIPTTCLTATYLPTTQPNISTTSYADTFDNIKQSIVAIECVDTDTRTIGAGVCCSEMGHIVTNTHVIDNYNIINVININGDKYPATVLYSDKVLDIAILQIEQSNIPPLTLSTIDIDIGDNVIAVGTPLSLVLKHTFTKGIISATNRTIRVNGSTGEYYMSGLLQHDASLNYGNSGGPLLDSKGNVIGINTLKITGGEGIGFAIPCKAFLNSLNKVINNQYSAPYLGIYGMDCSIAKFNKLTNTEMGYYIESVADNSPANDIMQAGDIVTAINNVAITCTLDYRNELYKYDANDCIDITYIHNNISITKKIQLGSKPNCK